MTRVRLLLLGVTTLAALAQVDARQDVNRADAVSMQRKLAAISERGEQPPAKPSAGKALPPPLTTTLVEREVNAYFRVNGSDVLPTGLENAQITIDDAGKVRGRALVDLDVALNTKGRSVWDPVSWLHGKTEVTAAAVFHGANGIGTFQLQSATLGGLTIPKSLLQQLVNYYTRTPENPAGFDLDKPFELPSNIRSVETERGQATIVQ